MTKKSQSGWWKQLQTGDYPKTKTSYGLGLLGISDSPSKSSPSKTRKVYREDSSAESVHEQNKHLVPKKTSDKYRSQKKASQSQQVKTSNRYSHYIVCIRCKHKKELTLGTTRNLQKKFNIEGPPYPDSLTKHMSRLKCSKCGARNPVVKIGKPSS